jgi:hypoxanthine-guanine phosphoribosyltransferase
MPVFEKCFKTKRVTEQVTEQITDACSVISDKEVCIIEDVISALKKIENTDCSEDVFETIEAAIEDLQNCV